MKLFGRMTYMSLAIILVCSLGFLSPMMVGGTARGATAGEGLSAPVIYLTGYTPTYKIGANTEIGSTGNKGYKLPTVTTNDASGITVTATTSSGKKATVTENAGTYYLVTDKAGKYYVTYTATKGTVTSSTREIVVEITSNGATLEFDSNSKQIIPTVAYAGNVIVFPNAKVMIDGEEDAVESDKVKITLKKAGSSTELTLGTKTEGEVEYSTYEIPTNDNAVYGDYVVTYTYTAGGVNLSKSETFRVIKSEQEVELAYSNNIQSKLESLSLEVGVEATLPTPVVINKKASSVDVSSKTYTVITIEGPATEEGKSNKTITVTDYKFTPWAAGKYTINYVTTDFFGHTNSAAINVTRTGIKLTSSSINLKPYSDYTVDSTKTSEDGYIDYDKLDMDEIESHEYDIKSVYYYGDEDDITISFPAILAKGWGDYGELKLTRTIYKNGNKKAVLEETTKEGGTTKYSANELASYTFSKGTTSSTANDSYEITYTAQYVDENGESISGIQKNKTYKFEIKDGAEPTDGTNLKIIAPSIPTLAVLKNAGETITFNAPTVSDDEDERLKVDVTYTFDVTTTYTATKNSDGKYEIDLEDYLSVDGYKSASAMTITFKVTNDLDAYDTVTKTIKLLDYSTDTAAPTVEITSDSQQASWESSTNKVKLPTVNFADLGSSVHSVIYILKGNKYIGQLDSSVTEYTPIYSAKSTYTFVYVATDQNYNTTTYSTSCEVEFLTGYSLIMSNPGEQDYGNEIDLTSYINVTKDNENFDFADANIIVQNVTGTDKMTQPALANGKMVIQVSGAYESVYAGPNGRIKCLDGDIYVRAWAMVNDIASSSDIISFTSADNDGPEFTVTGESENSEVLAYYEYDSAGVEITVPWFDDSISDAGAGIDVSSLKVELTYASESSAFATFTVDNANGVDGKTMTYTVKKEGKIKAKYSATDLKGNTTTREFWIYVGDVLAPEIIVANDAITAPSKVGEDCVINFDDITIENDPSLSKSSKLKVVVKINGTEVTTTDEFDENNNKIGIKFTASEAGDYVITFDITDNAGNEATTVTKTITVKADSVNRTNSSTVWGTIMIIISLIVVAVVIYFFVKPSKTKTKANSKKNK